ncbi:MAG TPA: ABC transporter permease [Acidimicrobiales bacterium]|nr:ABC transporter permease [Acidimicrobiales bacterium]
MLRLVARRLVLAVPLLFVVSTSTFLLVALIPGNIARTIVGAQATEQQYLSLRNSLGLELPLYTRYWHWLERALHGNLGVSLFSQQSVTSMLDSRLAPTLSLVIGATAVSALVGVALGLVGALRPGAIDWLVDVTALVGLAVPSFFLGLVLVSWTAVSLRVLPAIGYVPMGTSLSGWLKSLVLPVLTLSAGGIAVVAKQTRDAMRDVLERPFIRTLRASGLSSRSIVLKHALRCAAIPIVTVIGLVFIGVLSGAVVVESVFAFPGLGSLAVQATSESDLPLIQGIVIYFTIFVIAVNLCVDIVYGLLDPRVRAA